LIWRRIMRLLTSTLLAVCCFALTSFAQIDTLWTRILPYHNGNSYELTGAVGLSDGGFAFCGAVYNPETNQDNLIIRTNGQGEVLWMRDYGGMNTDAAWSIHELDDGSLRVFGTRYPFEVPQTYIYTLALDAQGDSLWTHYIEATDVYGTRGAAMLPDGNFMIAADSTDADFTYKAWLIKVSPQGIPIWSRTYSLGTYTLGRRVIASADGSLLVSGELRTDDWIFQAYVMRLSADGNILWSQNVSLPQSFGGEVTALEENQNGDIFVTAVVPGLWWWPAAILIKLDDEGNFLWASEPTAPENGMEYRGIAPYPNGGCVVAGHHVLEFSGYYSPILQEYEASGDPGELWQNNMLDWGFNGICQAASGGFLAYGWAGDEQGNHRGFLVRMGNPTVVTGRVTHVTNGAPLEGIRVALSTGAYDFSDSEGDYTVTSSASLVDIAVSGPCITPAFLENQTLIEGEVNIRNFAVGIPDYVREPSSVNLAIRYDVEFTETVRLRNFGSGDLDFTADVLSTIPNYDWLAVAPAAGTVPAGQTVQLTLIIFADSEQSTATDYFGTVRILNHSCPDSVDDLPVSAIALNVDGKPEGKVSEYALYPAYPNPFNSTTQLRFDLLAPGKTQLLLYDMTGRLVRSIISDYFEAGSHSVALDMAGQASGIYFVRMVNNRFTASRKIVFLK
jgi:hypothetical protein